MPSAKLLIVISWVTHDKKKSPQPAHKNSTLILIALLIVISWVTHNVGIQSIANSSKMQHPTSKLLPNECQLSRFPR